MKTPPPIEVAIVGSGILGLATAYHAARQGKQVHVFERDAFPVGASIRNFGMVWPIGQPAGFPLQTALRSRAIWEEVASQAGFWHLPNGSLHLAYREDEWQVMQEFAETAGEAGYQVRLLTPAETVEISPATQAEGLLGSLFSETEMLVDPREVPSKLIQWLQAEFGVQFHFQSAVRAIEEQTLWVGAESFPFEQLYVCCGAVLEPLFPEILQSAGMQKVKLQMMRTAPQPNQWRMGPSLCGGLTLTHYASFAHCPSLDQLKNRIQQETPHFPEWGIHVMMSQNGLGELVIGDSHEYGPTHDPFLKESVNAYILDYLHQMAQAPDLSIAERWYGVYAKLAGEIAFVHEVNEHITLFTGVGGAGMTLSFGLAEMVVAGEYPTQET